jgi:hypothetical protein
MLVKLRVASLVAVYTSPLSLIAEPVLLLPPALSVVLPLTVSTALQHQSISWGMLSVILISIALLGMRSCIATMGLPTSALSAGIVLRWQLMM